MPMYEYKCGNGHRFEEIQKFADDPVDHCECGAPCKRLLSRSSFSLKGDGWANDGYDKRAVEHDFKRTAQRSKNKVLREEFNYDAPE